MLISIRYKISINIAVRSWGPRRRYPACRVEIGNGTKGGTRCGGPAPKSVDKNRKEWVPLRGKSLMKVARSSALVMRSRYRELVGALFVEARRMPILLPH
jgi:hypothetical protein